MNDEKQKFPTPRGQSATNAKRKYNEKKYERFELSLPKGMKEKIDEAAKAAGYDSKRSFLLAMITEKYEQVMGKPMEITPPEQENV